MFYDLRAQREFTAHDESLQRQIEPFFFSELWSGARMVELKLPCVVGQGGNCLTSVRVATGVVCPS